MSGILLVDMGNSRIKWAWLTEGDIELNHAAYGDSPLTDLLDRVWSGLDTPRQVWLSCVDGRELALVEWTTQHWGVAANRVKSSRVFGTLSSGYHEPAKLGVDRWLALIGALATFPAQALCVVDLGTAVTLDIVDVSGQHLGGYIVPGLSLMRDSLSQRTGLLPGDAKTPGLGRDTGAAIILGTRTAVLGLIERAVAEHQRQTGSVPLVLLTGGDAGELTADMHLPFELRPGLVLKGLAEVAKQGNQDPCVGSSDS